MSTTSTPPGPDDPGGGLLAAPYAATTIGAFAMIVLVAFESLAVTTVMPEVARELDGLGLYASAFAAPLASGVVGMVAAGMWSDRRGPEEPLLTSFALFALGLVVCGLAPSMEVLVAGRVLQGLGGGAATVVLYVLVGLVFPPRLQPAVFATFAAAWVLPALFGPYLAALVAHAVGWRWVFLGTVALVVGATLVLVPSVRRAALPVPGSTTPLTRLLWATLAAAAVLTVEVTSDAPVVALLSVAVVVATLARLLPPGSLLLRRGLPSVIATRGLVSAAFFCAEAYIVFVLQETWGLTAAAAGVALTFVGLVWAVSSQVQARTPRVGHPAAMLTGTSVVLLGLCLLALAVWLQPPAPLAVAAYVVAGAGMGYGYPRTGVAMLGHSTDADQGMNSSALSIADSLGAALALALSGLAFAATDGAGQDPFVAVFALAAVVAALAVLAASRTRA